MAKYSSIIESLRAYVYNKDTLLFERSIVANSVEDGILIDEDCVVRIVCSRVGGSDIENPLDFENNIFIIKSGWEEDIGVGVKRGYLFGDFKTMYVPDAADLNPNGKSITGTTIEDLYGVYDELMASYPYAISKKLLGYGSTEDGEEDLDLPIYEYLITNPTDMSPKKAENNSPLILIVTSVHGWEKASSWGTAMFFKKMMNDWMNHNNLASIKSNCVFRIIPAVNPYGFNTNNAFNARGVNINRNFGYNWESYYHESYNKGETAYSELETQIVRDWLVEYSHADFFIDYHSVGDSIATTYLSSKNMEMRNVYGSLARRLTDVWRAKYNDLDEYTSYGYTETNDVPGTMNEATLVVGIIGSAVLEIGNTARGTSINDNPEILERADSLIGNFLLAILDNYNINRIQKSI